MNPEDTMRCETCRQDIRNHFEAVDLAEVDEEPARLLCISCYNKAEAAAEGLESIPPQYPSLTMTDLMGEKHTFNFITRLAGTSVSVEAYEQDGDPGYELVVLGPAAHSARLYLKLQGKIRRALSYRHLQQEGDELVLGEDLTARGMLSWDEESDGTLPMLVIDGKEIPWEEFGQIISTYEGWQFKLEIFDVSEER